MLLVENFKLLNTSLRSFTLLPQKTKPQKQKMHSTPFALPACHVVAPKRDSYLCKQTVIVFFSLSTGIELNPKPLNYICSPCFIFPLNVCDDLPVCKCPICA